MTYLGDYFGLSPEQNQKLLEMLKQEEWDEGLKSYLRENGVNPDRVNRDDISLEAAGVIADWIVTQSEAK